MIRKAGGQDIPFLRDMLRHAYYARWARLRSGDMEIAVWEASGDEGGVASVTVPDVRAEVDRLRAAGVEVGVIIELHGQVRIVDVFDPDGNRIQLTEEVS
jgi:catechol 2,3-dioxygenase-like lactoylglutathione lyase family enzyme